MRLAQHIIDNPILPPSYVDDTGGSYLSELLTNFLGIFLVAIFLVFFVLLIIGAIQWITAGGDKASVETARSRVMTAIIGVTIVFSVWAVVKLLEVFFGINILVINTDPLYINTSTLYPVIENPLYNTASRTVTGSSYTTSFVSAAILLAMTIGAVIFFVMFLFGAIQWISSGGDKGSVEAARSRLSNALIGLIIMFAIWAAVALIGSFFGLNLFELGFSRYYMGSSTSGTGCQCVYGTVVKSCSPGYVSTCSGSQGNQCWCN
jgi:TRAP-type C4-dicarboxylate transport system permease small subunit